MHPLTVIRHPLIFTGISVSEFLRWYFLEIPLKILRAYMAYLRAFVEIFSFHFLLRTLVSPWKQIKGMYAVQGLNITALSEALVLGMVSRTIGFLFRIVTIALGLAATAAITILFSVLIVAWLLYPLLFWTGLTYVASALFTMF